MLVLSREAGQSILIGDDITVTILELKSGKVKLGVEAPKSVQVDREEVRLRAGAQGKREGDV